MQTSTYTAVLGAILALILAAVLKRRQRRLPPGPRGLPIVGNIFDTPKSHDWLTYQEWSHKYGGHFGNYCGLLSSKVDMAARLGYRVFRGAREPRRCDKLDKGVA